MAAMYEEMYSVPPAEGGSSRRFSYPNSPSHSGSRPVGREKHSLTAHLQQLSLQHQLAEAGGIGSNTRFKGSITQGNFKKFKRMSLSKSPSKTDHKLFLINI